MEEETIIEEVEKEDFSLPEPSLKDMALVCTELYKGIPLMWEFKTVKEAKLLLEEKINAMENQ